MTAILAIDHIYNIFIIADCRATWPEKVPIYKDNLQKLYPLGPLGILGFAGSTYAAKIIFKKIRDETAKTRLPQNCNEIINNVGIWAKTAYKNVNKDNYVELMYAVIDKTAKEIIWKYSFGKTKLIKYISPEFKPEICKDMLTLGYANQLPRNIILENRSNMINPFMDKEHRRFYMQIIIETYGEGLAKLSPNSLNGVYIACDINNEGIRWQVYSNDKIKLDIENNQFVQTELITGRKTRLEALWNFDPYNQCNSNNTYKYFK